MTTVWECLCGMWNSNGDKVCPNCGRPKRKAPQVNRQRRRPVAHHERGPQYTYGTPWILVLLVVVALMADIGVVIWAAAWAVRSAS